jgi:dinuclear metal center YbgI/SA1388 family protein
MTVKATQIAKFCDDALFGDIDRNDDSLNGLQVECDGSVTKIGIAVDACMEAFELAKQNGCQMVMCHHGLFWKKLDPRPIGVMGNRIKFLFGNNISLWASHIPLDSNMTFGNNAVLAKAIALRTEGVFGEYHSKNLGVFGQYDEPKKIEYFIDCLSKNVVCCMPSFWQFGKTDIKSVGVVSGGGAYAIDEAGKLGLDLFITGEAKHQDYHLSKEYGLDVIIAGHYATETTGIGELGKLVANKFGVESVFLKAPTGL